MTLQTVNVIGQYLKADNATPLTGTIEFIPPFPLLFGDTVISDSIKKTLDSEGRFSATLVATDNVGARPASWVYQVLVRLNGVPTRRYYAKFDSSAQPINISTVAPADPSDYRYVPVAGPQGPIGPQGVQGNPGGTAQYVLTQTSPASTWVVNHNLGISPKVAIILDNGQLVLTDITYINGNSLVIDFPAPTTGKAVCS